jgi:hypothetical protein
MLELLRGIVGFSSGIQKPTGALGRGPLEVARRPTGSASVCDSCTYEVSRAGLAPKHL